MAVRYVYAFTPIWNDGGSGADRDVSFWKPIGGGSNYYPLGDVAIASHGQPHYAVMVSDLYGNALSPPTHAIEVWNDRGSGARRDVKVLQLIPRYGYRCLGYVAVEGYNTYVDTTQYRYV